MLGRPTVRALANACALTVALALLSSATAGAALNVGPNDVYVRVVDTGPGLCTVTEIPGGWWMVYDAGHWIGSQCIDAVREIVDGDEIVLLVISHSDGDHLGQADDILDEYLVYRMVTTGFRHQDTSSWRNMNSRIGEEAKNDATVINLQTYDLVPGEQLALGDATVTLVAGWPIWEDSGPTSSEKRNAVSIVVKLEYEGRSVLFTGDTVGRRKSDPDRACKDAEAAMLARHNDPQDPVSLASDVIIAPHHGGNNGSSACFISAVNPDFVIFSAGHQHQHPSSGAARTGDNQA